MADIHNKVDCLVSIKECQGKTGKGNLCKMMQGEVAHATSSKNEYNYCIVYIKLYHTNSFISSSSISDFSFFELPGNITILN